MTYAPILSLATGIDEFMVQPDPHKHGLLVDHVYTDHHPKALRPDIIAKLFVRLTDQARSISSDDFTEVLAHYSASADAVLTNPVAIQLGMECYMNARHNVTFHTVNGLIGHMPFCMDRDKLESPASESSAMPGVLVCVLYGSEHPSILRLMDSHYILIGQCHVVGLMNGEAMAALEAGELREQVFHIR